MRGVPKCYKEENLEEGALTRSGEVRWPSLPPYSPSHRRPQATNAKVTPDQCQQVSSDATSTYFNYKYKDIAASDAAEQVRDTQCHFVPQPCCVPQKDLGANGDRGGLKGKRKMVEEEKDEVSDSFRDSLCHILIKTIEGHKETSFLEAARRHCQP
ncbi:hypothetical protein NEOLEDRAFT_1143288 [Neolentinus lepideus HHB14362 ss-1]|uniref:Uncharacterized protein n=1 Tax=Neolentinus lepideus HHB14362 ss-1 TaxID=1314782 RepID=A0A165MN21_9AGAM|nr:hypothetical protein NEOLEDRAFT_1143288 [Neolentinus lepideus HHB14362 ss-1]